MLSNRNFTDIKTLIQPKFTIYAHCRGEEKKELLEEHTNLCQAYFLKLVKSKEIEKSFSYMIEHAFWNISEEGKNLCEEMFYNVVTFHDIGKCNPLFQSQIMKNPILKQVTPYARLKTHHSILSAVWYIDYFLIKLKKIREDVPKEEYKRMRHILFLHAYIIARHHSDLGKFEDFLNEFFEDGAAYNAIEIMEETREQIFKKPMQIKTTNAYKVCKKVKEVMEQMTSETAIILYTYERLLYSLLVASDYYATTEFMNGFQVEYFGDSNEMEQFYQALQETKLNQSIREYEKQHYNAEKQNLEQEKDITVLRNELFLDTEKELKKQKDESIFYLEAPTGSGKSNTAFHLAFWLWKENSLGKMFYVYPLNTLVEQNQKSLEKILENNPILQDKITVINSITPIRCEDKKQKYSDKKVGSANEREEAVKGETEENEYLYEKALLNRQFYNYPVILTTNVSLFHMMFDHRQENIFGFHQLMNSVLVLDEIQNYKSMIWTEIIRFLHVFSKMLSMKVIIMSATLPNLNELMEAEQPMVRLVLNREKYFSHPLFSKRVQLDFHLLDETEVEEALFRHVVKESQKKKKILMEFIKKKSAEQFYQRLTEARQRKEIEIEVLSMTGDHNAIERAKILEKINHPNAQENGMILVATQVVEAGVDIDMDIGYKDVSKLDSEEQFLGRINRSCKKKGKVYFFDLDQMQKIYKEDVRVNQEFTIFSEDMRAVLIEKSFTAYYQPVLEQLKEIKKQNREDNIDLFFKEKVGCLDFPVIADRMKLIEEDEWSISVFLARTLEDLEGRIIDGKAVWKEYRELLQERELEYSKKQVLLSEVKSKMNYFIYQIPKKSDIKYHDQIGELYYIEDGETFFEDGTLNRKKIEEMGGLFLD